MNHEVMRLGSDKVKILNRIKDFRKNIGQTAWEHRHLSQAVQNFEEHFKDLQLTRVTRNLHEMLEVIGSGEYIQLIYRSVET